MNRDIPIGVPRGRLPAAGPNSTTAPAMRLNGVAGSGDGWRPSRDARHCVCTCSLIGLLSWQIALTKQTESKEGVIPQRRL